MKELQILSLFQTEDNIMAPEFGTNGAYIRDVAPNYSYPEDIVNEVHQDGLIFAGAVWDWWQQLRGDIGDEADMKLWCLYRSWTQSWTDDTHSV